ncbi:hypothetical protein ISU10_13535 [Nocardioides agariphilus]|uniref:ACT domain-containing protein n=1 Tax=Nocardioides agariphilus TaxID=433664 RepID=A0A930VQD8_9ACTN|nr:hypothetical protein [Nocardioides agariphilus]MBF4768787.1 hypothetical protein [Nocardioides agariphilus]
MNSPAPVVLTVAALHEVGLLARLAAVLNSLPVTSFSYQVQEPRGRVALLVEVGGDPWHHWRAAQLLRRVVGVTNGSVRETVTG